MLILPVIIAADPPFGILISLKMLNSFFLLLLTYLKEKFQNKIPIICELAFKALHTLYFFLVFFFSHAFVQAVIYNLVHPAGIKKLKLSFLRNFNKITVKERLTSFFLGRRIHGRNLKETWVNVFYYFTKYTAFSGGSPAFKQYQYRQSMFLYLHLQCRQLCSCRAQTFLKFICFRYLWFRPVF